MDIGRRVLSRPHRINPAADPGSNKDDVAVFARNSDFVIRGKGYSSQKAYHSGMTVNCRRVQRRETMEATARPWLCAGSKKTHANLEMTKGRRGMQRRLAVVPRWVLHISSHTYQQGNNVRGIPAGGKMKRRHPLQVLRVVQLPPEARFISTTGLASVVQEKISCHTNAQQLHSQH